MTASTGFVYQVSMRVSFIKEAVFMKFIKIQTVVTATKLSET